MKSHAPWPDRMESELQKRTTTALLVLGVGVLAACSTTEDPAPPPSYKPQSSSVAGATAPTQAKPTFHRLPRVVTAAQVSNALSCDQVSVTPPKESPFPLTSLACTFGDEDIHVDTWASASQLQASLRKASAEARKQGVTVYGVTNNLWTVRYDFTGAQLPGAPAKSRAVADTIRRTVGGTVVPLG